MCLQNCDCTVMGQTDVAWCHTVVYWQFTGSLLVVYWQFTGSLLECLLVVYWQFTGSLLECLLAVYS